MSTVMSNGDGEIPTVDIDQTTDATDALLLDVREVSEWINGHIAGTVNIPLGELSDRLAEVDRDRRVIVICRSGNRSGLATRLLCSIGIDAHNMQGGSLAWAAAGKALVSSDGRPGIVV